MNIRETSVPGAYVVEVPQHRDERGLFLEHYKAAQLLADVGRDFTVAQANCSVSRRGALRGIHFCDVPPGQAKYVMCLRGSVFDAIVDVRVGSPTFGKTETVVLDDVERRSVFLSEGLGHGFMALSDDATLLYLCSTPYTPGAEHAIDPLDQRLAIRWPLDVEVLSAKDAAAPSLAEAVDLRLLPDFGDCLAIASVPPRS